LPASGAVAGFSVSATVAGGLAAVFFLVFAKAAPEDEDDRLQDEVDRHSKRPQRQPRIRGSGGGIVGLRRLGIVDELTFS
jgi:hypothetical protein